MSPLLSLALLLAVADSAVLPSGDQIGSPAEEVYAGIPPAEYYSEVPGRFLKETKPKRKFCNTTQYALKGDYAYEACGAFCKQAKAPNHCKFCKCRACAFCKAAAATASASSSAGGSAGVSSASSSAPSGAAVAPKKKKGGVGGGAYPKKKRTGGVGGGGGAKKKAKRILKRKLRETESSKSV